MAKKPTACPFCEKQSLRHLTGYYRCSVCKSVAWTPSELIKRIIEKNPRPCPECNNLSFHEIAPILKSHIFSLCNVCGFTGVIENKEISLKSQKKETQAQIDILWGKIEKLHNRSQILMWGIPGVSDGLQKARRQELKEVETQEKKIATLWIEARKELARLEKRKM